MFFPVRLFTKITIFHMSVEKDFKSNVSELSQVQSFAKENMSLNVNKNKAQILDAWKKVTDHEDGYDWALFGYEGRTVDLKVVSGTETLQDENAKLIEKFPHRMQ